MTRACLGLLAGVCALQLSSFSGQFDVSTALIVALFAGLLGYLRITVWFLSGAVLFYVAAQSVVDARVAPELLGDSIVLQVQIPDFPRQNGQTVSFLAVPQADDRMPRRIRLHWFEPPVDLHIGDVWQLEIRLKRPRSTANPGGFDYEAWLFREQIAATGYVVSGHRNHLLGAGRLGPVQSVRDRFVTRVMRVIQGNEQAAVLAAVVVGARHLISTEQWRRYALTGSSHLMAISGLHIGLAAAGAYALASVLGGLGGSRRNHHDVAILCSLLATALYASVSGFAVPAQRASLMIALAGVALLRRRRAQPFLIVFAACITMIAAAPLATMTPGFRLSFAAVIVLLWLTHRSAIPTTGKAGRLSQPLTALRQLGAVQLSLLLGLLPLTALIFGRVSLVAPLVNMIAVPLFSVVTVPLALAGLLCDGPAQIIGDQCLLLAAYSIAWIERLITTAAATNWATLAVPEISGLAWLYVALPVMWVVLPPGWPGRHVAWLAFVALALYMPRAPATGCAAIAVLDVGQGLAVIVRTHQQVLLFDAGPSFRGGGSAGKSIVLPYLASQGIHRIDRLVVSHADLDHAGGIADILAGIDVGDVLAGEPLSGHPSRPCLAGDQWVADGVRFRILHPPVDSDYVGNNTSCVLLLEVGARHVLLTGDIEHPVEALLLQEQSLPAVDVLVVPHHGSNTSSSAPFVHALAPNVAIVSAGFGNRWGFPKNSVVDRWRAVGAKVVTTARAGAVSLQLCEREPSLDIHRHRAEQRRIWHEAG